MDEKNQKLTVTIDGDIPRTLVGDDQRLAQVIINLLSNAVKFTPEGGSINLGAHFIGDRNGRSVVKIEVSDTGIGISREQQSHLFNSFQQAAANTNRKFGGTGLGLVISKNIVKMMHGNIWVESELGRGATFAFTVAMKRGVRKPKKQACYCLKKENVRVLAVDDDPDVLAYIADILHRFDIPCDTASCGESALELINRTGPYNIYFIDWNMPGINGIDLTKELKDKEHGNGNIAIIMVSSVEWRAIETDAKRAGVDRFIQKPLFPSDIADIINAFLGVQTPDREAVMAEAPVNLKGTNILMAEDVEVNREIVTAMLEPTGIEIDCAENGEEAVRMFSEFPEKYSLIFMDVQMPELDGYEATKKIRDSGNPNGKIIPIVAMTANVFKDDIEKCIVSGMNQHIGKPLDFGEIMGVLKTYLVK